MIGNASANLNSEKEKKKNRTIFCPTFELMQAQAKNNILHINLQRRFLASKT